MSCSHGNDLQHTERASASNGLEDDGEAEVLNGLVNVTDVSDRH